MTSDKKDTSNKSDNKSDNKSEPVTDKKTDKSEDAPKDKTESAAKKEHSVKEVAEELIEVGKKESKGCVRKARRWWKKRKNCSHVAVIHLNGVIGQVGGLRKNGLTLESLEEDINKAFATKNLKAVALRINSPGGSPVQSELICGRIRALSQEKSVPVYSFVEDVAASGGYWLACAGEEIYASRSSILGSIGVISASFGFVEAIKKLGIERRIVAQGENKSILDPFEKTKEDDIKILSDAQKEVHEAFIEHVKECRKGKIKPANNKQLFSGAFFNGAKAKNLGLVDELNDMHSVIKAKLGDNVQYHKISRPQSFLKRKLGLGTHGSVAEQVTDQCFSKVEERWWWSRVGL